MELHSATGISYLTAKLPVFGAILLVLISVFLTYIAGLIPSRMAAKKDPVVALRSEQNILKYLGANFLEFNS